jgi:hypothetical protein
MCFRGLREDPRWLDEEKRLFFPVPTLSLKLTLLMAELYSTLCYVKADLSQVPKLKRYSVHLPSFFHEVEFDVILSLGLTEFKAFIAWTENVRNILLSFPTNDGCVFYECRAKRKGQVIDLSFEYSANTCFRSPAQMVYDPDTLIVDSTSEV